MSTAWDGARKTHLLFAQRRIQDHVEMLGGSLQTAAHLLTRLRNLQEAIYRLDEYGERTWHIDGARLDELWTEIEAELMAFGVERGEARWLCRDLVAYQGLELEMRHGDSPAQVGMERFYHLKASDVRLARELIRLVTGRDEDAELRQAWDLYDIAGEVCDDIEDADEDFGTFNGNRFLLALAERSLRETAIEYQDFAMALLRRARSLSACRSRTARCPRTIARWAIARLNSVSPAVSRWKLLRGVRVGPFPRDVGLPPFCHGCGPAGIRTLERSSGLG